MSKGKREEMHSKEGIRQKKLKTKLRGLSPRANYTDRANFFAGRGCHMVSVTDLYGRILGFLDRSRYFFFQVAPQLYLRV
jgi:hypothetical protein